MNKIESLELLAREGTRVKIVHATDGKIFGALIHIINQKDDWVEYYDVEQRLYKISLSGIEDARQDNGF